MAAIDCVTYALLRRYRPDALAETRMLGFTYSAPAPPYVTQARLPDNLKKRLSAAMQRAFTDPTFRAIARDLFLIGMEDPLATDYRRIETEFVSERPLTKAKPRGR